MQSRWLIVGDTEHGEFRPAVRQLECEVRLVKTPTIDAATRLLAGEQEPIDWIVLAQRTPGEFAAEDVARLQRHAPLARFVVLLGSWCEGETRTGRPIAGVVRVLWHQWATRFERLLPQLHAGPFTAWSLPPTAAPEELLLADATATLHAAKRQAVDGVSAEVGFVAVVSDNRRMAEWLVDVCRSCGFHGEWATMSSLPSDNISGFVCDGDEPKRMIETVKSIRARYSVPIVALTNFARWQEHSALVEAGCSVVLNKPVSLSDLRHALLKASVEA